MVVSLSRHRFIFASAYVAWFSACIVFITARGAEHMGASTLIFGYFAHLLMAAWLEGISNPHFVVIAGVVTCWFGLSMILTLFSFSTNTSWESHIAGFITGMGSAYHYLTLYGETVKDTAEWDKTVAEAVPYLPQFPVWSIANIANENKDNFGMFDMDKQYAV